jgi:hypothetical protein
MRMNTDALVLKVTDTGESDRLVTLLTAEYGVIRAFANRAKKINSKMHGATQTLCYGEFSVYRSRDSYIIDDAVAKEVFLGYTILVRNERQGFFVNDKITRAKLNAKRLCKKLRGILNRRFNINLALKRKGDPENPLLAVNVKGEIPREIVAFFAALGVITAIWAIIKLLKKF